MKIKPIYIIVAVLIILSGVLAYSAFTSYISPYLTVSQVADNSGEYVGRDVQVLGVVKNGSISWNQNGTMSFDLSDEKSSIRVLYSGSPPQNFNEGQQVVAIGTLASPLQLSATQMLVKCPSKYEGEQTSLLTDPVFLIAIILGAVALVYYVASVFLKKG